MTTTLSAPELQLSSPVNLRDMGGIPIEGGVLREGVAIRTDDLAIATEADVQELIAGGLTAIIDLRSASEVGVTGRGPFGETTVAYHHLPLSTVDGGMPMTKRPNGDPVSVHVSMGEGYVEMVENAAPNLVAALGVIAVAPGAVAFHCAAGRDRTGVLAAVLLLALGASDEAVLADYGKTDANMEAINDRVMPLLGDLLVKLGMDMEELSQLSFSDEPMEIAMTTMFTTLRERHGDVLAPLRAAGLTDATIAQLREKALA